MNETQEYVISIMSRDRVGIVYEVSKAISDLQGNISNIRQSVLCGYFTMILLVTFPKDVSKRLIERKFAEIDANSETVIDSVVKPVDYKDTDLINESAYDNNYVLTATGTDQIGFVAALSSFCTGHNINIVDLSTTASNGIYVMILIVDLSRCSSIQTVRQNLETFAQERELKVVLQHYDVFRAMNEIYLPIH